MDEADYAQVFSDRYIAGAIAESAKKLRAGCRGGSVTSPFCEECGEEIPLARREAMPGCTRCVDCQAEMENSGID